MVKFLGAQGLQASRHRWLSLNSWGRSECRISVNGGLIKLDPYSDTVNAGGNDIGGALASATINHYDADGHLLQEQVFAHTATWQGDGATATPPATMPAVDDTTWAGMGLQNEVSYKSSGGAVGSGYDAVGNVTAYQYDDVTTGRTDTYTVSYLKKDGYLEKATAGSSSNSNYVPATDTSYYDNLGERIAIDQHVQLSSGTLADTVRAFAFDGNGQILQRRDGTASGSTFTAQGKAGTHHYAYVNGQQVASVDEGGGIDVVNGLTAFSNTDAGTSGYVVQFGDTLKSIAQNEYGDASLWYVVAQANGLGSDADLVVGQTLTIPQVTTSANTANTFKPYNPSHIAGSTTPPSVYAPPPPPPSSHHCNAIAAIVVIAVAVIVSAATYGAASGAMSAWAAGALAGAAGSAASQAAGMALGVQHGFDWGQVAIGAVGGAIGGGLAARDGAFAKAFAGTGANGISPTGNAIIGAASYTGSYETAKLVGEPAHFSWAGLVATSAGSAAGSRFGTTNEQNQAGQVGQWLDRIEANAMQDIVTRETSLGLGDHHVQSWQQIGEDVFGNALGNAAVAGYGELRSQAEQQSMDKLNETENALLAKEHVRLNADMEQSTSAESNGYFEALQLQADRALSAKIEADLYRQTTLDPAPWPTGLDNIAGSVIGISGLATPWIAYPRASFATVSYRNSGLNLNAGAELAGSYELGAGDYVGAGLTVASSGEEQLFKWANKQGVSEATVAEGGSESSILGIKYGSKALVGDVFGVAGGLIAIGETYHAYSSGDYRGATQSGGAALGAIAGAEFLAPWGSLAGPLAPVAVPVLAGVGALGGAILGSGIAEKVYDNGFEGNIRMVTQPINTIKAEASDLLFQWNMLMLGAHAWGH